jgi:hypothetical protein
MDGGKAKVFSFFVHRLIDLALFFRSSVGTGREIHAGDSAVSANMRERMV